MKKPETNEPVNENEEFCCMFSTKLNNQRLLYGAEMDGIECEAAYDIDNVDLNKCKFIELKVKLKEKFGRQKQNFLRYKLRNWWCQCFLANIKKVIYGTRNADGIVCDITPIHVNDIPKQVGVSNCHKQNFYFQISLNSICFFQNMWSPAVCMEFCDKFLKLIAKEMKNVDSPYTVYRFDYDPEKSNYINMQIFENKNEHCFLPEWYIRQTTL